MPSVGFTFGHGLFGGPGTRRLNRYGGGGREHTQIAFSFVPKVKTSPPDAPGICSAER